MLVSNNFRAVVRTLGIAVPMLALLTSCNRDPLAPDCFVVDNGECLIPYPGSSDIIVSCETFPEGAVGADYFLDLNEITMGGTGVYSNWSGTNLPPGLTLDPTSGVLSGVPEEVMAFQQIEISVTDAVGGETFTFTCGELVINDRLSALGVRNESFHCIPHTATKAEMVELLTGGDTSDITCMPVEDTGPPCPLGDGNGRPPPGITFDADTCTHSGNLTGDRRGSWVWMVEVEQNGFETAVPFCAQNDVDTFHDITLTANNVEESDLQPGLLEFNPDQSLGFGNGTHVWAIDDPACTNDPAPCNSYGFKFDITCSPFDPPFVLDGQSTDFGMTHELTAQGPIPVEKFRYRPFVASFEMSYCTSDTGADCDVDGAFEQNAQTRYHYDVVGFPTL